MRTGRRSWLSVFLLTAATALGALDPAVPLSRLVHKSWNGRDGLPQSSVFGLAQDRDGFMWLGTAAGLVRFDGFRFRVFTPGDTPALPASSVQCLGNFQGEVWAAAGGEMAVSGPRGWRRVGEKEGWDGGRVTAAAGNGQEIWFGTLSGRLFARRGGSFVPVSFPVSLSLPVQALALAAGGGWIGRSDGLWRVEAGRAWRVPAGPGGAVADVRAVCPIASTGVWAGGAGGLQRYERVGASWRPVGRPLLPRRTVTALARDRRGTLWIGTDAGLHRLAVGGVDPGPPFLESESVTAVGEDQWGNVWIGTLAGGLHLVQEGKFRLFDAGDGLPAGGVQCVYRDADGTLWCGASDGLYRLLEREMRFVCAPPDAGRWVSALHRDRRGVFWIGTRSGLWRRTAAGWSAERGLPEVPVAVLFEERGGALWAGTVGAGAWRLENGRWSSWSGRDGLPSDVVGAFVEERDGTLWIGTAAGLARRRAGRLHPAGSAAPAGMAVHDLYRDEGGRVWAAGEEGILCGENGRFSPPVGEGPPLRGPFHRILPDLSGNLWCSSAAGLFILSPGEGGARSGMGLHWRRLDAGDGLPGEVFSAGGRPAGERGRDGSLWFATPRGLLMVNPMFPLFIGSRFPSRLEALRGDGRPFPLHPALVLPAATRQVAFEFSKVEYIAPGQVLIRYRLTGTNTALFSLRLNYDSGVHVTDPRRPLVFHDLPADTYLLRWNACHSDGLWEENTREFTFSIAPAFHRSMLFFILLGALFGLAAAMVPRLLAVIAERRRERARKYKGSLLLPAAAQRHILRLRRWMEEGKPYLDPNLDQESVARALHISRETLSRVLSEQLQTNLKSYINKYRIEEACRRLADPATGDDKLLKIAFEVGFNSKSVFNEAFRRHTGVSPSVYRRRARGADDSR